MTAKENVLNWFEVSVNDINRAKKFYETIFDIKMESQNMMGMEMAFFPWEQGGGKLSGGLVKSQMHKPSTDGVKVYFNGNPDLSTVLSKVEQAGGISCHTGRHNCFFRAPRDGALRDVHPVVTSPDALYGKSGDGG